jgi:hypothetical protein
MAAPTNAAHVKKALANSEPSTHGTSRQFAASQHFGRFWSKAEVGRPLEPTDSVANDPEETSASISCCTREAASNPTGTSIGATSKVT